MRKLLLIVCIALVLIGFSFSSIKKIFAPSTPSPIISTFEECLQAGYPIMESYPRQCKTPAGKTYVETIKNSIIYTNASTDTITVDSPLPGAVVAKNFLVTGKARGTWYFEASFPIEVLDSNGKRIARGIAQAQSDWMTTSFVPFKATIIMPDTYEGPATLVLKKDNPSGLPTNDASISFSISKQPESQNTTTLKLYLYNPTLDQGVGGAQCSKKGLVQVGRTAPRTITPIQDAVKLLLLGEIDKVEKSKGLTSEFPLLGVSLLAASLTDGVLTLTFTDPQNKTIGGSCRVGILKNQIEMTAKQFSAVKSVRFMPEELFQP